MEAETLAPTLDCVKCVYLACFLDGLMLTLCSPLMSFKWDDELLAAWLYLLGFAPCP